MDDGVSSGEVLFFSNKEPADRQLKSPHKANIIPVLKNKNTQSAYGLSNDARNLSSEVKKASRKKRRRNISS